MTPMFIQQPFWNMTHSLPRSRCTTVNVKDALYPPEIADRSLAVRDDIAKVLSGLRKLLES